MVFAEGVSSVTGVQVPVVECINFTALGILNYQSCPLDRKRNRLLHLKADSLGIVFGLDGIQDESVVLPYLGHENDSYIDDDLLVTIDGNALSGADYQKVYEYNLETKDLRTSNCQIGGGLSYARVVGGICKYNTSEHLIVAYDYRGNYNEQGDKLYVYTLDRLYSTTNLIFTYDWDGWFVQGATYINGYLYVATNMLPEIYNGIGWYTGICLWKIDVQSKSIVDKINIYGRFEPEGLDSYYENGTPYLLMGIGSHQTQEVTCLLTKIKI